MSLGGSGQGGVSTSGTTAVFKSLPYKGYRELDPWFEEFVNAVAAEMEILEQRFITSTARSNMLDPTYTPPYPAEGSLATATAAPTHAISQDSMVDILSYVALGTYPLNQNFTTAEKQGMIATGGNLQRRKGTRQALLKTAAAACANVIAGWTVPPFNFSLILPDGLPSPGWGSWGPTSTQQSGTVSTTSGSAAVTGASTAFTANWTGYRIAIVSGSTVLTDWVKSVASTTSLTTVNNLGSTLAGASFWISPGASFRPWIFEALRQVLGQFFPAWSAFGLSYSQFRAGYSAAGEPILPSGATLDRIVNPHFDTWSAGVPTSWTSAGSGTLTQSPSVAEINFEVTSSAAQIDLSAAAAGVGRTLSQSAKINNQLSHRVEVDYAYTNAQLVDELTLQIVDDTNGSYWNGSAWQAAAYSIPLPVSTGAAVRKRYGTTVTPQANSTTATTLGTASITIKVSATSDGTSSTKIVYTVYRASLFPMYSSSVETAAGGERTLWMPLVDAQGLSLAVASGSATIVEPANASRSAYKLVTGTSNAFPYHPALTGRGLRSRASWTNLIKGSNDFGADWTLTTATKTANTTISPLIGETSASAPTLTTTATSANIFTLPGSAPITPTNKSYVGGVWVKKLSSDSVFSDVSLSLVSTSTKTSSYLVSQSQGWVLLPIRATFGAGDVAALVFAITWGFTISGGQIAVADAYLYDVTGTADVLYPPVVRTSAGSTAASGTRAAKAITATQDSNVLDPNLQRSMVAVTRGVVQLTVVPTYGAASQPNGVIFDFGASTTTNRVVVDINSGTLRARAIDNTPTTSSASLTMTTNSDPTSTQVTWQRDSAIVIRVRWQDNGKISLSANSSTATSTTPGSWSPVETSVAKIRFGCDIGDANHFDGIVTAADALQVGSPVT